jgi:hypothetical protein
MALDIISNKLDDRLSQLLLENLNTEEQQIFVKSFKAYLEYGNDDTAFVISLDDVWEWVGFSKKDKAKDLLIKHFDENIHYSMALPGERERFYVGEKTRGGKYYPTN